MPQGRVPNVLNFSSSTLDLTINADSQTDTIRPDSFFHLYCLHTTVISLVSLDLVLNYAGIYKIGIRPYHSATGFSGIVLFPTCTSNKYMEMMNQQSSTELNAGTYVVHPYINDLPPTTHFLTNVLLCAEHVPQSLNSVIL